MSRTFLITGGAGFIGSNYAHRLIKRGENVVILDNLSRKGAKENLNWLEQSFGKEAFIFIQGDIRNRDELINASKSAEIIVHLAAQVAVTSSIANPRTDFEINALGTFNVLEAAKNSKKQPLVLYASTNKVYGGMEDLKIREEEMRYSFIDLPLGIGEDRPIDFHSPYGCSKGCADQYVRDFARIYHLPTVVFRQSCIYGPRQFGIEDQGWVAWFIIAAQLGKPLSIYGDGKQVRDLLFIDDLLDVYDAAVEKNKLCTGQIFNIGGGINHTISIWKEFQPLMERILRREVPYQVYDWRQGDQKVYISDIRKAENALQWSLKVNIDEGMNRLNLWVTENIHFFS